MDSQLQQLCKNVALLPPRDSYWKNTVQTVLQAIQNLLEFNPEEDPRLTQYFFNDNNLKKLINQTSRQSDKTKITPICETAIQRLQKQWINLDQYTKNTLKALVRPTLPTSMDEVSHTNQKANGTIS